MCGEGPPHPYIFKKALNYVFLLLYGQRIRAALIQYRIHLYRVVAVEWRGRQGEKRTGKIDKRDSTEQENTEM